VRNKTSPIEYLAFLTLKYKVDADNFFRALVSAERNRRSDCGSLTIECRGKQKQDIVYLITKGAKVVTQFKISTGFLLNRNNPLRDARKANVLCRRLMEKGGGPHSFQIKDLRIGMKSVNLKADVVEIAEPTCVVTRFGNYANVANALLSDETGKIKLCLWNDQIKSVSVGDTIQIENARITTFRGERQVRVGKNGTLHSCRTVVVN
jgi:replication factor A1